MAVAAVLFAACVGGCDVYRVNHLHNDANQKLADEAMDSFESFTSDTAGLTPQLLRNIDARATVDKAVADAEGRVDDGAKAALTTEMTWERLRLELYTQLGLLVKKDKDTDKFRPYHLDDSTEYAQALDEVKDKNYDDLLRNRIVVRREKVTAAAKVFKVLADAHRVLAAEGAKRLSKNAEELAELDKNDTPSESEDKPENARVAWVRKLFKTIYDTRELYTQNPKLYAAASEVQRKVLADIEKSRDPVEAVALVPAAGTGLSAQDFLLLDAYLQALNEQLKWLADDIAALKPKPEEKPTNEADAAWKSLADSLDDAQQTVALAVALTEEDIDPEDNKFSGKGVRRRPTIPNPRAVKREAVQKFLNTRPRPLKTAPAEGAATATPTAALPPATATLTAGSGAEHLANLMTTKSYYKQVWPAEKSRAGRALTTAAGVLNENSLKPEQRSSNLYLHQKVLLAKHIENDELDKTIEAIRAARALIGGSAAKARAAAAATNAPAAGIAKLAAKKVNKRLALEAAIREKEATLQASRNRGASPEQVAPDRIELASLENTLADLQKSSTGDAGVDKGIEFLNKFVGLDVKVAGVLDDAVAKKVLTDDQLKYIGSVADDILKGEVDKHRRLLQFLSDLYNAQVDLQQEDVRHADAMLTIANIEFRRWVLLGALNASYEEVYRDARQGTASNSNTFDLPVSLFSTEDDIKMWGQRHPLKPKPEAFDVRNHPHVELGERKNDGSWKVEGDQIWPSIRKLAQTARALHTENQIDDPSGFNLRVASHRLYLAIRTVNGHLLMISVNRHMSEDNATRLRKELASHSVQLDSLETRAIEAEQRLTLGDLKAFHASGVTQQDLQTITNALLVWIGIGVQ